MDISSRLQDILYAADAVDISAGAIAGAMVEENNGYNDVDKWLDRYAASSTDPVIAATTLPLAMAGGATGLAAWVVLSTH
ncbi:MAG: hypothetical protein ABIK92_13545 [Pseudomonadota bacterium]